jgi:hypothetical protein
MYGPGKNRLGSDRTVGYDGPTFDLRSVMTAPRGYQ